MCVVVENELPLEGCPFDSCLLNNEQIKGPQYFSADVAQLVEQSIRNRQVTSSTLVVGSRFSQLQANRNQRNSRGSDCCSELFPFGLVRGSR